MTSYTKALDCFNLISELTDIPNTCTSLLHARFSLLKQKSIINLNIIIMKSNLNLRFIDIIGFDFINCSNDIFRIDRYIK